MMRNAWENPALLGRVFNGNEVFRLWLRAAATRAPGKPT